MSDRQHFRPAREGRRVSTSFTPRDEDGSRDRSWDRDRGGRDQSTRDIYRDRHRSLSRDRHSPRDRDFDWNRRRPERPRPSRLDMSDRPATSNSNPNHLPTPQPSAITAPSPPVMSSKNTRPITEQLLRLVVPFCDLIQSKSKLMDAEQILNGRKSDLARQQEKTPDFPSSWQAIKRSVGNAERDSSTCNKNYAQQSERLHTALGEFSGPARDLVAAIVRDLLPERKASAPSPLTSSSGPPMAPKASQGPANANSLESRLANLEMQQRSQLAGFSKQLQSQQAMAAKTESELQTLRGTVQTLTAECGILRVRSRAAAEKEKLVDDLVEQKQRLNDRCAKLEAEQQKSTTECSRLEKLLEGNRAACEEHLHGKANASREEDGRLRQDVEKIRPELEEVKKQLSSSENHQLKAESALRGNHKKLSEVQDKIVLRLSIVEKHIPTIQGAYNEVIQDLKGLKASVVKSQSRSASPTSDNISAEVKNIASTLQSVNEEVQRHSELLSDFEPSELDKIWWASDKLDKMEKLVSALDGRQKEHEKEVQEVKRGASAAASRAGAASTISQSPKPQSPTSAPAVDNAGRAPDSDATRTANDAMHMANKAIKLAEGTKKAQDAMIVSVGDMVTGMRSDIASASKDSRGEAISIKARLDTLEQDMVDSTGPDGKQVGEVTVKILRLEQAMSESKGSLHTVATETNKLNTRVTRSLASLEARIDGLVQRCSDLASQHGPLPHLRPVPPPQAPVSRQASVVQDIKRPLSAASNGSAKRRRMESPRGLPPRPTASGNGNGNGPH